MKYSFRGFTILLSVFMTLFLVSNVASARPRYALANGVTSCTACHASPSGGGIRNVNGKLFGAFGIQTKKVPSQYYQVDFRSLLYVPERATQSRDGLGLMALIGAINIPVIEDDTSSTSFVGAVNYGNFAPVSLRDAYVRTEFKGKRIIEHVLFGLFTPAFGLPTDEHRTYSRIQSKTSFNDFMMGAMVSGHLFERDHFDLSIGQGFQSSAPQQAGTFSQGLTGGLYYNHRWIGANTPLMIGWSGSLYQRHPTATVTSAANPYAYSLYLGWSFNRSRNRRAPTQIMMEFSEAKYWNDSLINPDFGRNIITTSNQTYADQVKTSTSQSLSLYWYYDLSQTFTLTYKYEHLLPNRNYVGDYFERHGFGFRKVLTASSQLWLRYEQSLVGRPDIGVDNPAKNQAFWALYHFWF